MGGTGEWVAAKLSPREVVDLRQRVRDGYPSSQTAERFGINARYLPAIASGELRADVPTALPAWLPLCMSAGAYQLWRHDLPRMGLGACRPCDDCPLSFAKEMGRLGLCNGEPQIDDSEQVA
jgi:hypothetical protein